MEDPTSVVALLNVAGMLEGRKDVGGGRSAHLYVVCCRLGSEQQSNTAPDSRRVYCTAVYD